MVNYEDCCSLSLEEIHALRLDLQDGRDSGKRPRLRTRLDLSTTARLCGVFAKRLRKR